MPRKKRITKEIETGYVDANGEVISSSSLKEWLIPREEPDYVKLYLNAVLEYRDVGSSNTPTLMALMKYMTFADNETEGGQMIILNKFVRNKIAKELNIKPDTLRKNIDKLCNGKILRKLETDTYQVNPYLIGKGDWSSIKNLRASFDWKNGFVVTQTEHEEPNKHEETITEKANNQIKHQIEISDLNGTMVDTTTHEVIQPIKING